MTKREIASFSYTGDDCIWMIHTKYSLTDYHSLFLIAHSLQYQTHRSITNISLQTQYKHKDRLRFYNENKYIKILRLI